MTWKPYAPDAQGLGWMADREPGVKLEGYTAGAASLRDGAQATEDIAAVWAYLDRTGATVEDGYEVAVYDLDDLEEGDLSTTVARPDGEARVLNAGRWSETGGTSSIDLWAGIDSSSLVPGTYQGRGVANNEFVFPYYGQGAEVICTYGDLGGGAFAGRSIAAVRIRAMCSEIVWPAGQQPVGGSTITPALHIGGNIYLGPPTMVPANGSPVEVRGEWLANPSTGRSWTEADLDELAGLLGGTSGVGWQVTATGSANWLPVIYQGWVEVDSAPSDKRLAVGVIRPGPSIVGSWQRIELLDPADGSPAVWAKTAGQRALLVLRRRWGTGWALWRRVLGDGTYPNGWQQGIPVMLPSGRLGGTQDGAEASVGPIDEPGAFGLLLERDDGDLSVDSQPYISVGDDVSGRSGFFHYWTRVDTAQDLLQEFTPASNVDVGYLRVLAALEDPECTDDLLVELVELPGLTVEATVTFSPDDLGDDPSRFQLLEDYLPAEVSLASGTQYGLRFTSPAPANAGWRVQVLSAGRIGGPTSTPADVVNVTFADGVDELQVGATSYGELTAAAQVHSLPETPGGFAAAVTGPVDNVDAVALSWSATAISEGGGFDQYELERADDRTDWQRIANIADQDVTEFEDLEARLDVASSYRIRARRVDGAASEWSDVAEATPTGPECGWVLASNEAPDRALWVDSIGAVTRFEFPEEVAEHRPIGANGTLVLRELEDRLDRFRLTLFIAGLGALGGTPQTPTIAGQQAFDPLRILIGNRRDPDTGRKVLLPYVAVLAPGGDRWFAGVTTAGGERSEPDGSYSMDVTVIEQTDVAWAVTVDGGGVS